eukprot:Lankesteria_metandrocarpae@DN6135_c0_g1_i1.p1
MMVPSPALSKSNFRDSMLSVAAAPAPEGNSDAYFEDDEFQNDLQSPLKRRSSGGSKQLATAFNRVRSVVNPRAWGQQQNEGGQLQSLVNMSPNFYLSSQLLKTNERELNRPRSMVHRHSEFLTDDGSFQNASTPFLSSIQTGGTIFALMRQRTNAGFLPLMVVPVAEGDSADVDEELGPIIPPDISFEKGAAAENRNTTGTSNIASTSAGQVEYVVTLGSFISLSEERGGRRPTRPSLRRVGPRYFVGKACCIISEFPFYCTFYRLLEQMHKMFLRNVPYALGATTVESLIAAFTTYAPAPPRGVVQVRIKAEGLLHNFLRPPPNRLPVSQVPIHMFFESFSTIHALVLFKACLLERKVAIISHSLSLLGTICESICSLIFPLTLTSVYVPVLPVNLLEFCGSPTPYLFGIPKWASADVCIETLRAICSSVIIGDADTGELHLPAGGAVEPKMALGIPGATRRCSYEAMPLFPYKPCRKLLDDLEATLQLPVAPRLLKRRYAHPSSMMHPEFALITSPAIGAGNLLKGVNAAIADRFMFSRRESSESLSPVDEHEEGRLEVASAEERAATLNVVPVTAKVVGKAPPLTDIESDSLPADRDSKSKKRKSKKKAKVKRSESGGLWKLTNRMLSNQKPESTTTATTTTSTTTAAELHTEHHNDLSAEISSTPAVKSSNPFESPANAPSPKHHGIHLHAAAISETSTSTVVPTLNTILHPNYTLDTPRKLTVTTPRKLTLDLHGSPTARGGADQRSLSHANCTPRLASGNTPMTSIVSYQELDEARAERLHAPPDAALYPTHLLSALSDSYCFDTKSQHIPNSSDIGQLEGIAREVRALHGKIRQAFSTFIIGMLLN